MDVKKVFRGISKKLLTDFEISSEINHNGNKGDYREGTLRNFLLSGRLPKRFGVGSGEIIGPTRNVSKQSDLVIYDQLDGMSLIYEDDIQIFPIESVFGVIEVKSTLSKEELIKSLENIKSVKYLAPNESVTKKNSLMSMTYPRPKPFGIVFAYSLAGNSLESLVKNLKEWEQQNDKSLWPNLIVVLGEGIIHHYGEGIRNTSLFSNEDLLKAISASYLAYRKDTLFHFYSTLIDLCSNISLGSVNLKRYFNPAEQIGEYVVRNHDRVIRQGSENLFRFNHGFIDRVVKHCSSEGKIKHRELFEKQMGTIPQGMDDNYLDYEVFHYDPERLPGMHEVENPFELNNGQPVATQRMLQPSHCLEVDGSTYYFSWFYVEEDDIEPIKGSSRNDL
ncbi:DUF6602 domain-containing protein [Musicola keenii]|uniref:DUF6602 domain-containing protein n=1 Tax=Musicola keenii TaxID=2884250 RepID=UPI00178333D8|nr:DUF6602 domain-containing protein [Musicola keenii]